MTEKIIYIDGIGNGQANMGFTGEEIVRCRDCIHAHLCSNDWFYYCDYFSNWVMTRDDGFCSWGVRRNDN